MIRPVASSVDELLARATGRETLVAGDSKSGARFERVVIDGVAHVVKYLHVDDDWIMRSSGDLGCRPLAVWRSGLLDRLPPCLDHAIVGAAAGLGRNRWGVALLMRDVSAQLVPEGDTRISLAQQRRFLEHMAALHAAFWGWTDDIGLTPVFHRHVEFSARSMALEERLGWPDAVPPLVIEGWQRFERLGSKTASAVLDLTNDPTPLVDALALAPQTFLHGDWKMGNLGSHDDGRTILLDWAMPGQGCPTVELAWYLALNVARLPESKDDAAAFYRGALEALGVTTTPWWERALDLALLAGLVWFGWEKALRGPGPELDWWLGRAGEGLRWL